MGSTTTRRTDAQSNAVRPVPTTYTLNLDDPYHEHITVELMARAGESPNKTDHDWWAVKKMGRRCLNVKGQWEYEPQPSSRNDAFFARTRWPLDEALQRGLDYLRNK